MRPLSATLSLIVLVGVLLLFYRVQLINWLAPHLFSRAGLHDVIFELNDLAIDRVRIDRFAATIILPSGPVDIRIGELTCHYHVRGLLHGKVETITARAVDITLPTVPADEPSSGSDLFFTDPAELLQQIEKLPLPVEQVHVKNLHLHQNGTTITSIQVKATATDTGKQLTFSPPTNSNRTQIDQTHLVIAAGTNQLKAILLLDLAAVPSLLPQIDVDFLPSGMLEAELLLRAPPDIEPQLHLDVIVTNVQHPLLTATEMQLQLNLVRQQNEGSLLLFPASTLSIRGARSQELFLAALTANLAGHINIPLFTDPQGFQLQLHPAQLEVEITGTNLQHPLLTAKEVQLQLDLARQHAGEPLLLSPTSTFSIKEAKSQELTLAALTANLAGQFHGHLSAAPQDLHLQLQPAQPWKIDGLEMGALRFAPLQIADILADLYLDRQQLRLTASCAAPKGTGSIALTMTQQRDADLQGTASLQTDGFLVMTADNNLLHMLHDPALPITLEQGKIQMATQWAWNRTTPIQARLDLDLVLDQGRVVEVPFTGLTVEHKLQLLPHVVSIQPGLIRVHQVQGPVLPLANLQIKAGLGSPDGKSPSLLRIDKAEVELLGGRVEVEGCLYDFDRPENFCLLTIRDMDMEQIVAMQKVEGLTVDGRIGGRLPLALTAQGIQVDHGQLEHVGQGGIVRYRPPGGPPPGSPLTDYALKALEEFHYQHLGAQVEYMSDGTLIIALQLQGRSPHIKPDRPLHFNVTIEQNLLSLLQSLQYTQSLPGALHREIRR
jgi:hypothetical protein